MIEIDFNCPDCDVELTVEEEDIGDSLDCPSCGNVLEIAWDGEPPTPSPGAEDAGGESSDGAAAASGPSAPRRPGGKKKLKMGNRPKKKFTR